MVEIGQDVLDVCARIREVSPTLGVQWNDASEVFRIYELGEDGKQRTVCWIRELTPDLPEFLMSLEKGDYAAQVARIDAQAERDAEHAGLERRGELHERLKHAVRKDIGYKGHVFLPRGV